MTLLTLNMLAAAVILVRGMFGVIRMMNKCTPHGMRVAWLAMTTGAAGVLISPFYMIRIPTLWETALWVGVALYIIFDRREPAACGVTP